MRQPAGELQPVRSVGGHGLSPSGTAAWSPLADASPCRMFMLARVLLFAKRLYRACMWLHFNVVGHSYTFCCCFVVLHHLSRCAVYLNQSFMCNTCLLLLAMSKPCWL